MNTVFKPGKAIYIPYIALFLALVPYFVLSSKHGTSGELFRVFVVPLLSVVSFVTIRKGVNVSALERWIFIIAHVIFYLFFCFWMVQMIMNLVSSEVLWYVDKAQMLIGAFTIVFAGWLDREKPAMRNDASEN